jgi:hypothetical protein
MTLTMRCSEPGMSAVVAIVASWPGIAGRHQG